MIFGDTSGSLAGQQKGKSNLLVADASGYNYLYGDAYTMYDSSWGGSDTLIGGNGDDSLYGDADEMYGNSRGGNDVLMGGGGEIDFLFGEAYVMTDSSQGGNDQLTAQAIESYVFGDAMLMLGNSRGGNDVLTGNGAFNSLYGDALYLLENSRGGNDILIGGRSSALYGDAFSMSGKSVGGNDKLSISDASNGYMVGDAGLVDSIKVRGGSDILISGAGNDQMWGDFVEWVAGTPASAFGADIFRFGRNNGSDIVYDFQRGKDKIDLSLKGITGLNDFTTVVDGTNLVLSFGQNAADGQVTVVGVSTLSASDFIFAAT